MRSSNCGETEEFYAATVLAGQVLSGDWTGPIIVAAVESKGARYRVAHQIWLHEPGGYELIVPDGIYTIVAFGDEDGDAEFDPNEPAATLASDMAVAGEGLILLVNLALSRDDAAIVLYFLPCEECMAQAAKRAQSLISTMPHSLSKQEPSFTGSR